MNSKTNLGGPAAYLIGEITSGENGVATLWWSRAGKDHVRTIDGPIREEIEEYARRHGIPFDKAEGRHCGCNRPNRTSFAGTGKDQPNLSTSANHPDQVSEPLGKVSPVRIAGIQNRQH